MPDPNKRSDAAVVGSGNKAMGKSPLLTFRSWDNLKLARLGALKNKKELMTEDDFEKTSLETW